MGLTIGSIPVNMGSGIALAAANKTSRTLVIVTTIGVLIEVGTILGIVISTAGSRRLRTRFIGHTAAILRFLGIVAMLCRHIPEIPKAGGSLVLILGLSLTGAGFVVYTQFLRGLASEYRFRPGG